MPSLDILALPGLRAVETWDRSSSGRSTIVVAAEPTSPPRACPVCGDALRQHGVRQVQIKDAPMRGRPVVIELRRPRFLCARGHAVGPDLPVLAEGRRMTRRLVRFIGVAALRKRAFADVATETGVDVRTVREIFDELAGRLEEWFPPLAPRWLGIDEVHVAGRIPAVLTDVENNLLIDILPSRSQGSIAAAIGALEGRERIQAVAMDIYWPYRNAVAEALPGVPVIVDKRHVLELARRAMEKVRRTIWRRGRRRRRIRREDVALLNRRRFDLDEAEAATVAARCDQLPDLGAAYRLKEDFYAIWDLRGRAEAEMRFAAWRASIPAELEEIFGPVAATVEAWRDPVFDYFDFAGRVTNAYTETANGLIKEIQGLGRGYHFDRLRAKALHLHGRWTEEALRIHEAALAVQARPAAGGISEADLAAGLARRGLHLEPRTGLGQAGIWVGTAAE
jgi:transposase